MSLDATRRKMALRECKTLVDVAGEVRELLEDEDPDLETILFLLSELQSRSGKAKSLIEGKTKMKG